MESLLISILCVVGIFSVIVWFIFGMFGNRICGEAMYSFVMILLGLWNIMLLSLNLIFLNHTSFQVGMHIAGIVSFALVIVYKTIELAYCDKKE